MKTIILAIIVATVIVMTTAQETGDAKGRLLRDIGKAREVRLMNNEDIGQVGDQLTAFNEHKRANRRLTSDSDSFNPLTSLVENIKTTEGSGLLGSVTGILSKVKDNSRRRMRNLEDKPKSNLRLGGGLLRTIDQGSGVLRLKEEPTSLLNGLLNF